MPLIPPHKSLASEANESGGGGEANLSKTLTKKKKGIFPSSPLPQFRRLNTLQKELFPSENMFSSARFRIHVFYDRMIERKRKERKKINKLSVPNLAIVLIAI